MNYPRLLIVSPSAFNPFSGGGITFTNLFHGWPKDKIATVHSDPVPVTNDVCDSYYRLGKNEFAWKFPFSIANVFGGQAKVEGSLRGAKNRSFLGWLQKGVQYIFGEEIPVDVKLSAELREWIAKFKPEVIYTILGNLEYIRLVKKIAEEFKIPVVIHMMDDWPAVLYRRGIFGPHRRWQMKRELQDLINKSTRCLSICDEMAHAYKKRYGREFTSFHNALDSGVWLKNSRKEWRRGSPFTIVYGGALMEDSQLQSVKDVCDAVFELHNKGGLDIVFQIYAPWYFANRYRSALERDGCVKVFDAPETMEIQSLFVRADLLLLPVNFDKKSVNYVKYSMPTKVPAYMFSGTPTLAYGPDCVASIKYAKGFKWAYCVTERNQNALLEAIQTLNSDEELRKTLATRAQKIAQERHDGEKVRREFHEVLQISNLNYK